MFRRLHIRAKQLVGELFWWIRYGRKPVRCPETLRVVGLDYQCLSYKGHNGPHMTTKAKLKCWETTND